MSSSQPFASSPSSQRRRRSKFTYKHLSTLAQSATNCPLRVIAHIDLDAFYAQCESVRLGLDPSQPLAVQQWQGLIAINYPARAFGLSRHVPVNEAKEKCPEIICQHVATWKEGDTKWSYSEDAWKEIATRKVSLDPYRIESRKILATIKEALPADKQKVEKASIDEVFLDLSAHVHDILLERYPILRGPPPYEDPSELLPRPPTTALDWAADALVDLDSSQSEEDDPDWDDVALLIASEIVRDVRATIFEKLKYTCSGGLSRNKMLAKLGSGHKKPNAQTVIRNRAVQHFLSDIKFTKIRNLGGKLGDEVVAAFNTDLVSDILSVPIDQLKKRFGDDTGTWIHQVIRGEDNSEVNPRTQIKSMLSAKSFRPSINTLEAACKWLRIFVADIYGRLVDEGVLENKRRPRTINIHHRQGAQTRSKQAPIPLAKTITEDFLYDLAKKLLAQVIVDGRAWPCANLSLSVGGFEDGVTGNQGIGGFLIHGEEAKALNAANFTRDDASDYRHHTPPPHKKRRVQSSSIAHFFGSSSRQASTDDASTVEETASDSMVEPTRAGDIEDSPQFEDNWDSNEDDPGAPPTSAQPPRDSQCEGASMKRRSPDSAPEIYEIPENSYICQRCKGNVALEDKMQHDDFHFAQDLQNEPSSPPRPPPKPVPPAPVPAASSKPKGRGRPPASLGPPGKGQKRLAFG